MKKGPGVQRSLCAVVSFDDHEKRKREKGRKMGGVQLLLSLPYAVALSRHSLLAARGEKGGGGKRRDETR